MNSLSQGDILSRLYRSLEPLQDRLNALKNIVLDQNISNYPIIVLYMDADVDLGVAVPLGENFEWKAKLSFLEDFVKKGLIQGDKNIDAFRDKYKPRDTHTCLFVVDAVGANFVFYPHR